MVKYSDFDFSLYVVLIQSKLLTLLSTKVNTSGNSRGQRMENPIQGGELELSSPCVYLHNYLIEIQKITAKDG